MIIAILYESICPDVISLIHNIFHIKMIVEDDGGTRTSWKCSVTGKYNSKQYGFEIDLPLNSRDDIVWRGSLSRAAIEKYSGKVSPFGDVEVVLELI